MRYYISDLHFFHENIMGHADISTTMDIYADATEDKKKEVMTKLEGKIIL